MLADVDWLAIDTLNLADNQLTAFPTVLRRAARVENAGPHSQRRRRVRPAVAVPALRAAPPVPRRQRADGRGARVAHRGRGGRERATSFDPGRQPGEYLFL